MEELKRFAAILNDDYNKALKEKAEAIKEHQSEMKKLTADRDKQINELKRSKPTMRSLNSDIKKSQAVLQKSPRKSGTYSFSRDAMKCVKKRRGLEQRR